MQYIPRLLEPIIDHTLKREKSILLLGPRQTGKTTLIQKFSHDLELSFILPDVRQRYEKNPSLLVKEVELLWTKKQPLMPLVVLDEIQKVPDILDVVQYLIDQKKAQFILTGSSARKLRRGTNINPLPGRVVALRLDPLTLQESAADRVEDRLYYGSLPGIFQTENTQDKERDLLSYVTQYLEEEIRSEAIVRNLGAFARFLEYAASESGQICNFRKLSQEIGVAHTTIAAYYQILEDCLLVEKIEALSQGSVRKRLNKTPKYLFFDLGVRRVSAREGMPLPLETLGRMFEQFVGLELIRYAKLSLKQIRIRFWRDHAGPEVDWVLDIEGRYIPVEVKWTDSPSESMAKSLHVFLDEYPQALKGYIVCQTLRSFQLTQRVEAVSWRDLHKIFEN